MSELGMIITVVISLPLSVVNIVACVHVITAAVSSELKEQRNEPSDWNRTAMWGVLWVCITIVWVVAIGIASTL